TAALDEGLRADRLLRQIGQRPMVHHNLYMVSFIHTLMGDLAEGERTGRESVAGNQEVGNRRDEAFAHAAAGQSLLHQARLDEAQERFAEAEDDVFLHRMEHGFIAILAWERVQDADGLEATASRLVKVADGESQLYSSWGHYALALASVLRGDDARALPELEG